MLTYCHTEQQIDYWADVFFSLGLSAQGILFAAFLEDPWRYLRQIGNTGTTEPVPTLLS